MSHLLYSLAAPSFLLMQMPKWLKDQFWIDLYQHGKFGEQENNLALLISVRLLAVALILIATRVVVGLLRRTIKRTLTVLNQRSYTEQQRLTTLYGILSSTLNYVIYFVAIILILSTIGVSWAKLAPLLGLASVLGLAIGFGAQRLVRDVITGLFILGEGQFDVGDWVTIGAVTGRVVEIGLRITKIRDEQGRMYIIANGDITQVFNASRGLVRLPVELALSRANQLDEALEVIQRIAENTLEAHQVTPSGSHERLSVTVVGMDATKVTVRLTTWVPVIQKEAIEHALRRALLDGFANAEFTLV